MKDACEKNTTSLFGVKEIIAEYMHRRESRRRGSDPLHSHPSHCGH